MWYINSMYHMYLFNLTFFSSSFFQILFRFLCHQTRPPQDRSQSEMSHTQQVTVYSLPISGQCLYMNQAIKKVDWLCFNLLSCPRRSTEWTSVPEAPFNRTEGNETGTFTLFVNSKVKLSCSGVKLMMMMTFLLVVSADGQDRQQAESRSSTFLVFLVTFLILSLLVVVIFFTIKLRGAHVAWKKGKETV